MNKTEKKMDEKGNPKDKGRLKEMNDSNANERDSKTGTAKDEGGLGQMNGQSEKG